MRPASWNVSNVLGFSYTYNGGSTVGGNNQVSYARNLSSNGGRDSTLDRSYEYDQVGALVFAHSGAEARAAFGIDGQQWGTSDGPYSHEYDYDKQGNMTLRSGWGGEVQGGSRNGGDTTLTYSYPNNQRTDLAYDLAGNVTSDASQWYTYDATGQQTTANALGGYLLQQFYDGDGLRGKKNDAGAVTYYLRSSVLGGQIVAEMDGAGNWTRGYTYQKGQLLTVQENGHLYWSHEDPITKSKWITDVNGGVQSTLELDPWGANTDRSYDAAFQPQTFTTYTLDANGGFDAKYRRYSATGRFAQPDPYGGSYNFADPQSLNRYAYTGNDPVNRRDPSGLTFTPLVPLPQVWTVTVKASPEPVSGGSLIGGLVGNDAMAILESAAEGIEPEPQNTGYSHPKPGSSGECRRFAAIVAELARKNGDPAKFMQALKGFFLDRNLPDWGSGGFKPEFKDDTPPNNSPNQVYHYVGTFEAGYEGGRTLGYELGYHAGLAVTNEHEVEYQIRRGARGGYESVPLPPTPSHKADMRLNGISVDQGAQLGSGLIKPSQLADLIRRDVCQ